MQRIHLDHNATTPIRPEARAELVAQLDALRGNPSSVHAAGRAARAMLDRARERVAAALCVHEDEVVFTSGGTEALHLAILGGLFAQSKERGLLTTRVEHSAGLGAAELVAAAGRPVEFLEVDREARLDLELASARARDPRVGLISIQAANNEVGTLYPIADIARARRASPAGALFHTDAVQALGRIPVRPRDWDVDLASFSAHKVGGPLGVGILYKRKGVALAPVLRGGGQEFGLRPGTENVPAIAAAAVAIELAVVEQADSAQRWRELTTSLWRMLRASWPEVRINGPSIDANDRLPNTLDVALPGTDGRTLVARLDLEGLEASAGSACASGSLEPSHVLLAMGRSEEEARAALRLSLGRTTRGEDVHNAVEILGRIRHERR